MPSRKTRTRAVNFRRLEQLGEAGALIVKLQMACLDMQYASEALRGWQRQQPRHRRERQAGGTLYFTKIQAGHLHEALKIIDEIRNRPDFMALVQQCDSQTIASFDELVSCRTDPNKKAWIEDHISQLRHNAVFHYGPGTSKLIQRAIVDRAGRADGQQSSMTRGNNTYLWHFQPAVDVTSTIVVRQIWKIPRSPPGQRHIDQAAAEAIQERIHEIQMAFIDFAGEFIWKHCGR